MSNKIVNSIIGFLGASSSTILIKYIVIFVISLFPILELRGGLIAASILDVPAFPAYIVCIIGNILPLPFILIFLDSVFDFMIKHNILKRFVLWCSKKGNEKKDKILKYGFWGLVLFVGIPLPGTGAWTGALIATLLRMDKKRSFLAILLGILIASIIMMLISYGILGNIIR